MPEHRASSGKAVVLGQHKEVAAGLVSPLDSISPCTSRRWRPLTEVHRMRAAIKCLS
jgi:hypothetical protein